MKGGGRSSSFPYQRGLGAFCLRGTFLNSTNSIFSFWLKFQASALPLCLIGVSRGFPDKGTGFDSLRRSSASSVKCSGNLWGCTSSDSKSPKYCGVHVPGTAERHSGIRQKACVLSLILSVSRCQPHRLQRPQRGSTDYSTGFPLARANVHQIRHIKKLIVPLGLDCSLSEPVHKIQWSRKRKNRPRQTDTYKHGQWLHAPQTVINIDSLWMYWAPSINRKSLCKMVCHSIAITGYSLDIFPLTHNQPEKTFKFTFCLFNKTFCRRHRLGKKLFHPEESQCC